MPKNKNNYNQLIIYIKIIYFTEILFLLLFISYKLVIMLGLLPDTLPQYNNQLVLLLLGLLMLHIYLLQKDLTKIKSFKSEIASKSDMLTNMENLNVALRSQRHDFLNHIQVLYSLIELEEYDEVTNYLNRLYGDLESLNKHIKTGQPAINALLLAKEQTALGHDIQYKTLIQSKMTDPSLPPWEICRCLANIIDNSITAVKGADYPYVRITLSEDIHSYYISIENNGPMIPRDSYDSIFVAGFTTKNKTGHGMGLHIVKQTLEKFGGSIALQSDEESTCFQMSFAKTSGDN